MMTIYIDADACPVKDEIYKVANRYELTVIVVANQFLNIPSNTRISLQVVKGNFDAADDWIVNTSEAKDIVVTSDILLASRCVEKGLKALSPKGHEFTEDNIGQAIAGRKLSEHLRQEGRTGTGPSAMTKTDRSQFLSKLDQVIQKLLKQKAKP